MELLILLGRIDWRRGICKGLQFPFKKEVPESESCFVYKLYYVEDLVQPKEDVLSSFKAIQSEAGETLRFLSLIITTNFSLQQRVLYRSIHKFFLVLEEYPRSLF